MSDPNIPWAFVAFWIVFAVLTVAVGWALARIKVHRWLWYRLTARHRARQVPAGDDAKSVSDAVTRLSRAGYEHSLHADGRWLVGPGVRVDPEWLVVDEVVTLEGEHDPDDETLIIAVREPDAGIRGTYVVPYGATTTHEDGEILARLVVHGAA